MHLNNTLRHASLLASQHSKPCFRDQGPKWPVMAAALRLERKQRQAASAASLLGALTHDLSGCWRCSGA